MLSHCFNVLSFCLASEFSLGHIILENCLFPDLLNYNFKFSDRDFVLLVMFSIGLGFHPEEVESI